MSVLFERISTAKTGNPYFEKDLKKAKLANKFIGHGSIISSTHKYMVAAGDLANTGEYTSEDKVFVSAEGTRRGRLPINCKELDKAIASKVTFITDDPYNRSREYNLGEREVAFYLKKSGYVEVNKGVWQLK